MAKTETKPPRLPPRWFIRLSWFTHRGVYRLARGRLGLWRPKRKGCGAMRLTTIGRRTGESRSVMVGYFEDGPNLVTLAMNGWGEGEPAWWLNLQAHPDAHIDMRDGPRLVTGRAAHGEEGDEPIGQTVGVFRDRDFPSLHDRQPLLAFIRERLDAAGCLPDPVCSLPDESRRTPGAIAWMAGAFDGVMGHHSGGADQTADKPRDLAALLAAAATKPRRRQLARLHDALTTDDVLAFLDPMIEHLVALRPPAADIAGLATWLASTSPDRGPVKVGIALLGITGAPDGALLHDLGAHEELTLYAAAAFANGRENPEPDLFALAKRVQGWGRIQCVERLRNTTDPEIARWILTQGFRNKVMNEYLAHIAATTGDLAGALAVPSPDRETLSAAGDIIAALIAGGPAEDIDDYPDAAAALGRWLGHVQRHARTVDELLTTCSIIEFCDRDDWASRIVDGGAWTDEQHTAIHDQARALLADPRWPPIVTTALDSPDHYAFHRAVGAARVLGIDTFDRLLDRIEADPIDGPWFLAWQHADSTRAELLADKARRLLDLRAVATGPSEAIGVGPDFKLHAALGWTLQGIRSHVGIGADLVDAGLQSPTVQNRNGAMNVLEDWGRPSWSRQHVQRLEVLAAGDPNDKARQRAAEFLADVTTPAADPADPPS